MLSKITPSFEWKIHSSWSVSAWIFIHQIMPTNSFPVIFLNVQKSTEAARRTSVNPRILFFVPTKNLNLLIVYNNIGSNFRRTASKQNWMLSYIFWLSSNRFLISSFISSVLGGSALRLPSCSNYVLRSVIVKSLVLVYNLKHRKSINIYLKNHSSSYKKIYFLSGLLERALVGFSMTDISPNRIF